MCDHWNSKAFVFFLLGERKEGGNLQNLYFEKVHAHVPRNQLLLVVGQRKVGMRAIELDIIYEKT